jgi:hypothetical protein
VKSVEKFGMNFFSLEGAITFVLTIIITARQVRARLLEYLK